MYLASEFWSNTGANLIGTFVGAALAIGGALFLERKSRTRAERLSIQALVDHAHRSRAFAPASTGHSSMSDAHAGGDRQRCNLSVLNTRNRIGDVRDRVSNHSDALPILDQMYVDCLEYLERTELNPEGYGEELMNLRERLEARFEELSAVVPSLDVKSPGMAMASAAQPIR